MKSSVIRVAPLDHLERKRVEPGLAYAVVLDMVVPGIFAVGYLRDELVPIDVAALVENGLEALLYRLPAEAREQPFHAAAHPSRRP